VLTPNPQSKRQDSNLRGSNDQKKYFYFKLCLSLLSIFRLSMNMGALGGQPIIKLSNEPPHEYDAPFKWGRLKI
jgi:hypothetical protein